MAFGNNNFIKIDNVELSSLLNNTKSKVNDLWLDIKKDFGAKGDVVIDANSNIISGTDDSDAIQAALDAVRYETGSKIKLFFPPGRYRITKPIVGHRVSIFAEGNVTIYCDAPDAFFDFKPINPVALYEFYELFINKIAFRGRNGAKRAMRITAGSQFYIEKMYAYDFVETAVELIDCTIGNFVRPTVSHCGTAFLLNKVAGVSWMHGNVYMNTRADFEFKGSNGGIKFLDMWTEDSASTFLLDSSQGKVSVDGLIITDSIFGRNDLPGGPVFKINGQSAANSARMSNVIFENNRVNFYLANLNLADINLTGGNAGSLIQLQIKDNFLYNEFNPNEYAIKAVGNTIDQLQVIYEDNTTSGTVNIINGVGRIAGIDRSGALLSYYNKVRGELILDNPSITSNLAGALGWNTTTKMPRFSDGVNYRNLQPIDSGTTANRPTNPIVGQRYYDTTLFKDVVWSGTTWRLSTGGVDFKINRATILASTTSVVVTHGLSFTPTDVLLTAQGDVGNVWVSNITSTQFTINCKTAPAGNVVVSYQVQA